MTGAEAVLQTAAAAGVEVCFANPGTTEMPLVSALDRVPSIRAVLGLFEGDAFRKGFLSRIAALRNIAFEPSTTSFAAAREAQLDRLGDLIETHMDLAAIERLIEEAR